MAQSVYGFLSIEMVDLRGLPFLHQPFLLLTIREQRLFKLSSLFGGGAVGWPSPPLPSDHHTD